jgi:hypothetical protein
MARSAMPTASMAFAHVISPRRRAVNSVESEDFAFDIRHHPIHLKS